MMANAAFEDLTGSIGVLIFPAAYEQYKDEIKMDEICRIRARVAVGEETELLLEAVQPYTGPGQKPAWSFKKQEQQKTVVQKPALVRELRLTLEEEDIHKIRAIKNAMEGCYAAWGASVKVLVRSTGKRYTLKSVKYTTELREKLENILGMHNIEVI